MGFHKTGPSGPHPSIKDRRCYTNIRDSKGFTLVFISDSRTLLLLFCIHCPSKFILEKEKEKE